MLVLTRKLNQSVQIGEDIKVIVTGIQGGSVRVAIDAPRDVKILRSEIKHIPDNKGNRK